MRLIRVILILWLCAMACSAQEYLGTFDSLSADPQVAGVSDLLQATLHAQDEHGERVSFYVKNNGAMAALVANPSAFQGKKVKIYYHRVDLFLPQFNEVMNISQAYQMELAEPGANAQSREGSDQDAADAARIRGCQDDILNVQIFRQTIPGNAASTTIMLVTNVIRGSRRNGQQVEAFWDSAPPDRGGQYLIMGRVKEDGFFHVDPQIRYPTTWSKEDWLQKTVAP